MISERNFRHYIRIPFRTKSLLSSGMDWEDYTRGDFIAWRGDYLTKRGELLMAGRDCNNGETFSSHTRTVVRECCK